MFRFTMGRSLPRFRQSAKFGTKKYSFWLRGSVGLIGTSTVATLGLISSIGAIPLKNRPYRPTVSSEAETEASGSEI